MHSFGVEFRAIRCGPRSADEPRRVLWSGLPAWHQENRLQRLHSFVEVADPQVLVIGVLVWGFFSLYVASFILMYLAIALTGVDLMTAFSAVAACINNLGPGLAGVGAHYADLNATAKWILCFAMLLGRLEIFTLLVLLTPGFWQR